MSEDALFMLDAHGVVTSWSAGAERISGYRAEEIVGQHVSRLYTDEDRQAGRPQQALDAALRDGRHEHAGWRVRKDGSRFVASAVIEPLRDAAGELTGYAHLTRDFSEHAEMAHEFNNVVQVTGASMEALRHCLPAGDTRASGLLDILKRNMALAAGMMDRLLAYPDLEEPAGATDAAGAAKALIGLRVLVIEDESLIAMHVEDLLREFGCEVIGFASSVQKALELAAAAEMDFALLDINLQGERADPVAAALQARGIPFAFMSGDKATDEQWANLPTIRKPFELDQMQREIVRALRGA